MFTQIDNHAQQALARLIYQYQQSPNLQGLISAFCQSIQLIEDELVAMNTDRYINDAYGQQLDNIGEIVGLARTPGMTDAVYQRYLLGQIKINISQGQPEQLIQLYSLLTNTNFVLIFEGSLADVILSSSYQIPDQATADQFIDILQQATAAGVRVDGLICFDPDMAFAYDGPLPGFGYDDGSQTVGGSYPAYWNFIGGGFAYEGDDDSGMGYGTQLDPLAGGAYLD